MNLRTRGPALALVLGLAGTAPAPASASFLTRPIWTLATYVGGGNFDESFGVTEAVPIGVRLGFTAWDRFGLEGNFGKTFGESERVPERGYPIDQYGVDITFDIFPKSRINPYVAAGWAQLSLDESDTKVLHMTGKELAAGVKIRLVRDPVARWDLRLDARGIRVRNGSTPQGWGEMSEHFLFTVGFMMSMAGREDAPDRDRDGIPDRQDACPMTPRGAKVDSLGCPTDADQDGVPDGIDLCEGTPPDLIVDAEGCAQDEDLDGVFDGRDLCPETPPRVLTDLEGCPVPARAASVETDLDDAGFVALDGSSFTAGSSLLRPASQAILDEVGRVLAAKPDLPVQITGFADTVEAGERALDLAERRAKAVRDNLIARQTELASDRFRVDGRIAPVGSGAPSGTASTRRVEIRLLRPEALPPKR